MTLDQRSEGRLSRLIVAIANPTQKLAVRPLTDYARFKERLKIVNKGRWSFDSHGSRPPWLTVTQIVWRQPRAVPTFCDF
jgi:hypothetical protein